MAESRWIAFELHDGLMQWVIGARMHMAALVAALKEQPGGPATTDELEERLTQILSYLTQATEEGRQLIRFVEGLPEGEAVDVVETLASTCDLLARKTRDGRPAITFQPSERPWPQLPPHFAWTVVRIVQQAAVNAFRHSGAQNVSVVLSSTADAGQVSVLISDDGIGFDPALDYPGHFGLKSMRQRAREAGVELSIDSRPGGGGSRVRLAIPLAAMEKNPDA